MDTIAAIATPAARSAVGIVRLSGPRSAEILDALFVPQNGSRASAMPPRRMTYGMVRGAQGQTLDSALAVLFTEGASYTGEQSAELHCHGSPVVLGEVLRAAFAAGARQAAAGEFTQRAFLNGRLDLTQAEAVIDLIDAETAQAAKNAAAQLGGALRRRVEAVYDTLLDVTSRFYAVVDYPDEDLTDQTGDEHRAALSGAADAVDALVSSFARGRILKSGVKTAIIGAPNAGKSSLLNALVGFDRAIVTDVAGTTRDTVEERAVIGGTLLHLVDTAGLREGGDAVERLGIERSRAAAADAEMIFAVVDGSRPMHAEDEAALALARAAGKPWLLLLSKSDLGAADEPPALTDGAPHKTLCVSSVTLAGLDALGAAVAELFPSGAPQGETLVTNERQADALRRALEALRAAETALSSGITPDAALTEVERAQDALGELTGRTAREDMVARIFERFCVGK